MRVPDTSVGPPHCCVAVPAAERLSDSGTRLVVTVLDRWGNTRTDAAERLAWLPHRRQYRPSESGYGR